MRLIEEILGQYLGRLIGPVVLVAAVFLALATWFLSNARMAFPKQYIQFSILAVVGILLAVAGLFVLMTPWQAIGAVAVGAGLYACYYYGFAGGGDGRRS